MNALATAGRGAQAAGNPCRRSPGPAAAGTLGPGEGDVIDETRERRLVARIVAGDESALAAVYDGWSA
jgi:hypothetical protein